MTTIHSLIALIAGLGLIAQAQAATEKTIANLNTAFRGESNASQRYEAFAKKAEAEGYVQVGRLFRAASKAEAIHRDAHKLAITNLNGKPDDFKLDDVKAGDTKANLAAAIKGETYERDVMYPDFLKEARAEAVGLAIRTLNYALAAETEHAKVFQEALDQLGKNKAAPVYVCPICGFTTAAPGNNCPVCKTAREKFIKFE